MMQWAGKWFLVLVLATGILPSQGLSQADYKRYYDEDKLPQVREIFLRGRYDIVLQICDYALRRGQPSWEWRTLRMQSLENMGRYDEALEEAASISEAFKDELGPLLAVHEFYTEMGRKKEAAAMFEKINIAASAVPEKERDGLDLVFLGKAALVLGADPQVALEQYFEPAKAQKAKGKNVPPGLVEAHQASGELALDKSDYQLAAREFQAALKYEPDNPELRFGLARAFMPSNRKRGMEELEKVLSDSVLHFDSLLLKTEYAINYEQYDAAKQYLDLVQSINPSHPIAFAYRAVIAHLEENNDELFHAARDRALSIRQENPEIDHLIGRVLSRNYRFAEGAESQKRALAFDSGFLPAKLQLALDYLRLGQLDNAWPLAKEVGEADPYNVLAYNLEVLEQEVDSFAEIKTEHFLIRMPKEEADLYGDRALEILNKARGILEEKYGLRIDHPVLVEFYPDQQDFAVRSFGALGGEGLLGVCFGSVVTMNSPGSLAHGKNNWEATLWHEYTHVITLTATKNKMPRWLSEGISVYEEMQQNPLWGQRMTPRYREMILEEEAVTPVGDLSQAFYHAESGEHLMFAYYESMLVVQYIVEEFGIESLRGILSDLAEGVLINDAISSHTRPMQDLESSFAGFVSALATTMAPGVDWKKPEPEEVNPTSSIAVAKFLKENPKNFWARQTHTLYLLDRKMWDEAVTSAEALIELYPEYVESGNGYDLKARAFRGKGDTAAETETLEILAEKSAESYPAYTRLLNLNFENKNWTAVKENADRAMAINPFLKEIHFCRGCAHQALGETKPAINAFEKALELRPVNPSEVRYRLASLLEPIDPAQARRHLLDSLADSPRYRDAHKLLLAMNGEGKLPEPPNTESKPASPGVLPPTPEGKKEPTPAPARETKKVDPPDPFGGGGAMKKESPVPPAKKEAEKVERPQ